MKSAFAVFLILAAAQPFDTLRAAQPPATSTPQTPVPQTPAPQTPAPQTPAPQTPAAPTPAGPPPAVPSSRQFTSDAGIIFNIIKPDKAADFEAVMAKVKEALSKSNDPKRKQMALGWRVFKATESGFGNNLVYVFFFDPPVKNEDYQITRILDEAFPNEAQDLWKKFTDCFATGQSLLNLTQTTNMNPNATTTPR